MARLLTCPTLVLIDYLVFGARISRNKLISVFVLTSGVIIANQQFGIANPFGASVAAAGFTVTALYQIMIGRRLSGLKVSPPQLLFNQAPVAAMLLIVFVPFVDTMPDFSTFDGLRDDSPVRG